MTSGAAMRQRQRMQRMLGRLRRAPTPRRIHAPLALTKQTKQHNKQPQQTTTTTGIRSGDAVHVVQTSGLTTGSADAEARVPRRHLGAQPTARAALLPPAAAAGEPGDAVR